MITYGLLKYMIETVISDIGSIEFLDFWEFCLDIICSGVVIFILPVCLTLDVLMLPLEVLYLILKHNKKSKRQKEIDRWKELNGLK